MGCDKSRMILTELSGFSRAPTGLQCKFLIGGCENGPEMCLFFYSFTNALDSFSSLFVADFKFLGYDGVSVLWQPKLNPLSSPFNMKFTTSWLGCSFNKSLS